MAAQAWNAAEAWLGEQLSPVTIPGVDQAGPRLYLASVGDVQLAHRGLSRLAVSQAGPASSTTPPNPAPDGLPPVVAALTANQPAWLRDALDFLDRQDIDLVPGDFACRGFPEGRPAATVLGALLLERHNQLPFDHGQQQYLTHSAWKLGARLAAEIGEHAAAPYMRAWDLIVSAGGSQAVRRLLDAADAADAAGPA
jgi:hypothetical protein